MNYLDALRELSDGKKVKLPEWSGYWFLDKDSNPELHIEKRIRVLTKDGDILDTPWCEKYKNREDWAVTDGALGFDWALRALMNGKQVFRYGWNGQNAITPMFLYLIKGSALQTGLGYGFGEYAGEPRFVDTICLRTAQNTLVVGWKPTTPDMFSSDWAILGDSIKVNK